MAARNSPRFCHIRFGFIDVDANLARTAAIDFTLGRNSKSPRSTTTEPYTKPILEPTYAYGHGGRSEAEHSRRTRKTLVLNNPNERPHIPDGLHIRSLFTQIVFLKHGLSRL